MTPRRIRTAWGASLTAAVAIANLIIPATAVAVTGPEAAATYAFTVRVLVGDGDPARGCSAGLISREWVITTASCLADDITSVTAGKPQQKTTINIKGSAPDSTTAYTGTVAELVPAEGGRNVVMARLATSVPATIPTLALADEGLAAGDEATFAGTGRTKTEWVPDKPHTATFTVDSTDTTTLAISGKTAEDSICKGDTGGPLLRDTDNGPELVGLATRSWQGGCLGTPETETRTNAEAVRTDDLGDWISKTAGRARIRQVASGDFSSDGKSDAVAIDGADGNLYAYPGDGKGGFGGRNQLGTGWQTTRVITTGNFVGDSNTDLVAIRDNGVLLTYPGKGQGGFGPAITAGTGWNNMRLLSASDFNGDKKIDLLAVHTNGDLYIYPGTGDGKVASGIVASKGWSGIKLIASGDFNGDGKADVAAIHTNGYLYTYMGTGQNSFQTGIKGGGGWSTTGLIASGDFNTDGKTDLVTVRNGTTFYTYIGNGKGNFSTPVTTQP